jgi:predicted glutamine amidotransferase
MERRWEKITKRNLGEIMCRLLAVKAEPPFAITPHLEKFATISKHSKEYQGHGWGCAYQDKERTWQIYKNINPIWEDDLSGFPDTRLLVAHARSAFEDRDIAIENNMPCLFSTESFAVSVSKWKVV